MGFRGLPEDQQRLAERCARSPSWPVSSPGAQAEDPVFAAYDLRLGGHVDELGERTKAARS
jgi:hypothetical protein